MVKEDGCVFCQIANGAAPAKIVWENESFLAFENKYPSAPIHLLVIPREHVSKEELVRGGKSGFWDGLMAAVFAVVKEKGLDQKGYKLVNNGAGYNHFDHEHIHVMGGSEKLKD